MDEVDDEAFDMTAIVVLISHDHDGAVPEARYILVLLANLKSDDLAEILYLWVLTDLLCHRLPYVQELSTQRETAVLVSADDFNASHS